MNFTSVHMNLNENCGVPFLTYKAIEKIDFVKHAFSTRLGGVSQGEFKSMNLSFGRGDSDENVTENYKLFCNAVGFEYESLVASSQDHNTFVRVVTEKEKGIGIRKPKDIQSVDALVTDVSGVTLVTYYADCTPIFFIDREKKAIALAHAGWRGTRGRIVKNVIDVMKKSFGTHSSDLICAIGPVIGQCCYEVDEQCCNQFKDMKDIDTTDCIEAVGNGKYMLNLALINKKLLLAEGVLDGNITVSDVCTKCNSDLLWSHRATNGKRGTLSAFMQIR